MVQSLWQTVWSFFKILKHRTLPNNSTSEYTPREINTYVPPKTHRQTLTAVWLVTVKKWNQAKHPPTYEWINNGMSMCSNATEH